MVTTATGVSERSSGSEAGLRAAEPPHNMGHTVTNAPPAPNRLAATLKRLLPGNKPNDADGEAVSSRRGDPTRGIQLRRFAGPAAYTEQLEHIRIAHLTDMHVGRITPMKVQRAAVDMTNAEKPDLVLITGDFVCHSQFFLDELAAIVASFDAPVIGVLGNHDYWSGAKEVAHALRRAGAEILQNQTTTITLRHQRLQVVGLDDAYTGHADREAAVKGLRRDLPSIGLSHIAEEADALWSHGIPFVLSGHTHAGQVTLAKLHELTLGKLVGHKYVHGLYGTRRANAANAGAVYVGAGIGAAVIPLRLGERGQREITMFELGHQPGSFDEHHEEQAPLPGRKPSDKVKWKRAAKVVKNQIKRDRSRKADVE
jgi:predicted MPP superfamily phosphohydrolase